MDSQSKTNELRLWYSDETPPPADQVLEVVQSMEPATGYTCEGGQPTGHYAAMMKEIVEAMTSLQRNALPTAVRGFEGRIEQLLNSVLLFASTPKQRVEVLRELGMFRFRRAEPKEERQKKLAAAVRDVGEESTLPEQAAKLAAIWRPHPESFVDAMVNRPAEAARTLMRRAAGRDDASVTIIEHGSNGLEGEIRAAFLNTRAIAYQQDGAIHLLGGIGDYLKAYAVSDRADLAGDGLQPLHLLLLHELVEGIVQAEHSALTAHVVASTFERWLGGLSLKLAVEAFFADAVARTDSTVEESDAEEESPEEAWNDCIVEQDEIRPEAYEQKSLAEQRAILREMFGEDWSEEDDRALGEAA
jgi:hypothetical protein